MNKGNFFFSDDWKKIIGLAFKATNEEVCVIGEKIIIHKFPVGIFKIAYPNFPVGIQNFNTVLGIVNDKKFLTNQKVNGIRIISSEKLESFKKPVSIVTLPQTLITDLKTWSISSLSSSIRRNIRKSNKLNVEVMLSKSIDDSNAVIRIYQETIKRHKGKAKYNAIYFHELIRATKHNKDIFCFIAKTGDSEIIGYIVVATHKNMAYYLHGGIDYTYQNTRAMDALFNAAISHAKNMDITKFNFLTSPVDQPSLVRYKEKWGGVTSNVSTITYSKYKIINQILKYRNK